MLRAALMRMLDDGSRRGHGLRTGIAACHRYAGSHRLRAAPRDSAQQQALLWQGELLEVRGERLDYLQVYDYRRERGGFVRAARCGAPALSAGARRLSCWRCSASCAKRPAPRRWASALPPPTSQAAPAERCTARTGIEALDALGTLRRPPGASAPPPARQLGKPAQALLAGHLDVAARYGVNFTSHERDGPQVRMCYDGEAVPARARRCASSQEQRARARRWR